MEIIELLLKTGGGTIILTGIGWLAKDVYTRYVHKKEAKEKDDYLQGLRSIAKVYNCMDILKETKEITRVLLLEISNGGNVPRCGSIMYASAVNVKHDDIEMGRSILEKYNRVRIDDEYINMCIEAERTKGAYKIMVQDSRESLLKSFYMTEGIQYSEVFHIYTDGKDEKMFIMSVATENDDETFNKQGIRALINSEVSIIRSEFERYRN